MNRSAIALCLALSSTMPGPLLHADDWPQHMGPQRDDVWRETGILDRFPDGLHARLVSRRPRQRTRLGPPAVPVHDDGDVSRDRTLVEDRVEQRVGHPVTLP